MKPLLRAGVGVCLLLMVAGSAAAQEPAATQQAERWEFTGVTRITVDGVSGDMILLPAEGSTGVVELRQNVTPAGAFGGQVEQSGGTLRIDEQWEGRNTSGSVQWRIYLPRGGSPPGITIDTASGDLDADGINATIRFDTASGDISLNAVTLGEDSRFDTASGDIDLTDVTVGSGSDFDTASGDVRVRNCGLSGLTKFSSASGDVDIDLPNLPPGGI